MNNRPEIYLPRRNEWRNWLSENYELSKGIWLLFYKKDSGKPTLTYKEAIEEALCFGWIDGIIKNIDEEKYVRHFMPRTNLYNWSETNRKRVELLIKNGKMTEAGLLKIGDYVTTRKLKWETVSKDKMPETFSPDMIEALKKNTVAYTNFMNMTRSHQKRYIGWVMSAKQEITRQKRMKEAILLLEKNQKNLLK